MEANKFFLLRLVIEWTLIIVGLAGIYAHTNLAVFIPALVALFGIVWITMQITKEEMSEQVSIYKLPNGKMFVGTENSFIEFMEKVEKGEINLDAETERGEDEV